MNAAIMLLLTVQACGDSLPIDLAKHVTTAVIEHASSRPGTIISSDHVFIDRQSYARHLATLARRNIPEQRVDVAIGRDFRLAAREPSIECDWSTAKPREDGAVGRTSTDCWVEGYGIHISMDSTAVDSMGGTVVFVRRWVTRVRPDGTTRVMFAELSLEFGRSNSGGNWALVAVETLQEEEVTAVASG